VDQDPVGAVPAYSSDSAGKARKALGARPNDSTYCRRYSGFALALVFGEKVDFIVTLGTVVGLQDVMFRAGSY